MPEITCPVCHSVNDSTRTFCWKCASDLHAVVPDPTAPPPPPKVVVPIQPILIGGGVALAAIALIAVLVVLLGGSPAATTSPSGGLASTRPTGPASSSDGGAGSAGAPTAVAPTTVAPTPLLPTEPPPPTAAPPATPKVTPVPKPVIISFTGPATVNCADPTYTGFITLQWVVDNADSTTLSIDGPGVYSSYPGTLGTYQVPFSCGNVQHTYTLTTVGGTGPAATKTLTIVEDSGI